MHVGRIQKLGTGHFTSRHVRPLQLSLSEGLDKRFGSLFTDKSFLLAAVSHPKFKIAWCDDPAIRAQCTQLLENSILSTDNDITLDTPDATSSLVRVHSHTDSAHLACGISSLLHCVNSLCSLSSWFTSSYA